MTDASVVLGYLDPENFLGGRARLDARAAEAALDSLAADLKLSRMQAAEGVHRVVNTHMAEGVRLATVRRGVDPRRFALLGFGGAAGLHVTELARLLGITRVIVPRVASVLSAWGMLATELRTECMRSHIGDTGGLDADAVRTLFTGLDAGSCDRLGGWFDGEIRTSRTADMRYGEQIFEIDVKLDDIDFAGSDVMDRIKDAFETRHEELYTYCLKDQDPVLINARVAAIGALPAPPSEPGPSVEVAAEPQSRRPVYLGDWIEADIYGFDGLAAGQEVDGPAVIEAETTTVLFRPDDRAKVTPQGWLDIVVGG